MLPHRGHKYKEALVRVTRVPPQCGGALQQFHCPLPSGSVAVHCSKHSAARCPTQCGSALQEFHCPLPAGSEAVHCSSSSPHCPQAVRQWIAGVPLPTGQCGSALQEFHFPLPPGSWRCIARVPLPAAPEQRGSVLMVRLVQVTQCSAARHTQCSAVQCTAPSSAA